METYEKYKPSGIDWIGEVPEHWDNITLQNSADTFIDGDWIESPDISTEGIRYITTGNIGVLNYKEQGAGYITEETFKKLDCTEVFPGDVLISRLNEPIGRSCIIPELNNRIVTSVDNVIYRPKADIFNKQYVVYQMNCYPYTINANLLARGTTMHRISRSTLGKIKLILPPLAEQEAIAAYLDARCADIDKVVATQQKRIALLQELKQSEITQAVTRGLNPDVRMKDSGVEWIGMVPEHWEVIPFKSKFKTDKGLSITKADLVDEGVPVISYGQIHSKQNDYVHTLDHLLRFIPEEMAPADSKAKLEIGDIVFADTSEDVEGSGNAFYIDREGIYAGYHTVIAKSIERVDNKYFAYLFATPVWRSQVRSQVYGVKVFSITQQILKSTSLIAPPVEERKQIVEVLEEKCARIDKQIEKIQNQIELLREYKQALITEVVTGKRRV